MSDILWNDNKVGLKVWWIRLFEKERTISRNVLPKISYSASAPPASTNDTRGLTWMICFQFTLKCPLQVLILRYEINIIEYFYFQSMIIRQNFSISMEFELFWLTSLVLVCWSMLTFYLNEMSSILGRKSSQNEGSSVKSWLSSPKVESVGSGVQCLLLQFVKLWFQFLQFMFRLQSRDLADIDSQGQAGMIIWWSDE